MRRWILLLVVCAGAAQSALSQDQLAAIRAACAEDAQKLCTGVQPGGGRIAACLKAHKDSLSDQCKKAAGLAANPSSSSAAGASAAPPASETPASEARPVRPPPRPVLPAPRPVLTQSLPTAPVVRRKLRLQPVPALAPTCA